jgi:hypothetical protein
MKTMLYNGLIINMLLNVLVMGGCSGSNIDSSGITVSAEISPFYNDAYTSSVDVVQNSCSNGTTTQSEFFADHVAIASINAGLLNSSNIMGPMTVFLDGYTITYNGNTDSSGAPPIQPDTREMSVSFIVSSATPTLAASLTVELVDLIRKDQYYTVFGGGLNNYTATYTFSGHTENGYHFTITSQRDFQVGSFNYCPDGYSPL